jgi:hypothetical protein
MAVKVIDSGHTYFTASCAQCGCRFSYERDDIMGRTTFAGGWVACPECSTKHMHSLPVARTTGEPML